MIQQVDLLVKWQESNIVIFFFAYVAPLEWLTPQRLALSCATFNKAIGSFFFLSSSSIELRRITSALLKNYI